MLKFFTRPDIAFVVEMLGRYHSNLDLDHWRAIKKVMRYLQGRKNYMLMYRRTENLKVVGYSHSDFASCVDSRKSTCGYMFMSASGVVSWRSAKQTFIATSTMKVEFVSCFQGDCTRSKSGNRSKYIDIKYLAIRKRVKEGKVAIEYINTDLMLADPLTKSMPPKNFKDHV
ncbi:hypothetical protein Sango_2428700 [Sesamum angolense]|uniref:Retrovirus-related Pol polyprotein from transposon TNT 1-94 n=1 Tax=Sesamum angolense TaxID=2727404 RepID=A0AAE2BK12_9LAMI|nr:hypothetical protein Sango_2428700 [Sesamum angolense]